MDTLQPKIEVQVSQGDAPKVNLSDVDVSMFMLRKEFQVELPTKQDSEQLKWIYDFYDKQGIQDIDDVLTNIQLAKAKLGRTAYGVSPLTQVYQYLKILSQMSQLEQIKKGLEKE